MSSIFLRHVATNATAFRRLSSLKPAAINTKFARTTNTINQWRSYSARWSRYTKAHYGQSGSSQKSPFSTANGVSPNTIIYSIIGTNVIVFLAWNSALSRQQQRGDSTALKSMMKNFTVSWQGLREGRIWTLLTAGFSHISGTHLMVNMFTLYSFGTAMVTALGPRKFIKFYLGAAVVGSLCSAMFRRFVVYPQTGNPMSLGQPALGASTSVVGVTTLFAILFPHATVQLMFFINMPAWGVAAGLSAWDLWRLFNHDKTRTDGAGHLGGALAGLGYYWFRLRPLIRRIR